MAQNQQSNRQNSFTIKEAGESSKPRAKSLVQEKFPTYDLDHKIFANWLTDKYKSEKFQVKLRVEDAKYVFDVPWPLSEEDRKDRIPKLRTKVPPAPLTQLKEPSPPRTAVADGETGAH